MEGGRRSICEVKGILVLDLPATASGTQDRGDVPLVQPKVGHPAEVLLATVGMNFPVLRKVDQEFLVRFVQRHVVEKLETMPHAGRFVHRLPDRHVTIAFGLKDELEQELMIAFFRTVGEMFDRILL